MRAEEETESFPALVVGVAKEAASRLLGQKSQEKPQLLLGAKKRGTGPALWLKDPSLARDHMPKQPWRAAQQVLKRPVLKAGRNTGTVPTTFKTSMF